MRPSIPILAVASLVCLDQSLALAGPLGGTGGGGGGGGPLSQTASGIHGASGGAPSQTSSGSGSTASEVERDERERYECYDRHARRIRCPRNYAVGSVVLVERPEENPPPPAYTGDRARFHIYAGAQKVAGSDGSVSVDASVSDAYRFRLRGTLHHYFETQPDTSRLTMTMPTLTAGVRIDDLGTTAVHVEGGVVHAGTRGDPMGSLSITGPIVGLSLEHRFSKKLGVLGDVRTMWFEDDVRANAGQIGVRYGHVQASFRVLDFNVGPPLYGPEVGVRF